ncbi:hypothetical protein SAMN03159463_05314 [Mesorhizobium sp. NFR06]|nr:hypothetical protein SAMN03159463_05314 [Mesorhizobium sp. NFR06]
MTNLLIPTWRRSHVRAGTVSLAELLRRYDLAHCHKTTTRAALIASYLANGEASS